MTMTNRTPGGMRRRDFLDAAGAALATAALPAAAQAFPSRQVTLVVPYATGGPDVLVRLMAKALSEHLKQPAIVDNRPGASGMIGAAYVQRAKPDGYTVLVSGNSSLVVYPMLRKVAPLDVAADFEPICPILSYTMLLTVPGTLAVNSVADLVALLRRDPKRGVYGTPGAGSLAHMGSEVFADRTGLRLLQIPYKGVGEAQTALMAGDITIFMDGPQSAYELIKSGRVKALAVTASKRLPALPDVPTFQELGIAGMEMQVWLGAFAPKGTPPDVVKVLAAGITRALATPDVRDGISMGGLANALGGQPADLASMITTERAFWREVIARNKLSLE